MNKANRNTTLRESPYSVYQRGETFKNTDLSFIHFEEETDFQWATFEEVNLTGSRMEQSFMKGATFKKSKLQDIQIVYGRMPEVTFDSSNLRNGNFQSSNMSNSVWLNCDAQNANFYNGYLDGSKCYDVDFTEANFSFANLGNFCKITNHGYAKLATIAFKNCTFTNAIFYKTILNLKEFANSKFDGVDLQSVRIYNMHRLY